MAQISKVLKQVLPLTAQQRSLPAQIRFALEEKELTMPSTFLCSFQQLSN
jgi:hypothetical protein